MKILVDIGNTRTKYKYIEFIQNTHLYTEDIRSVDNNLINEEWLNTHWANVEKITIATVKGGKLSQLIELWSAATNIPTQFVVSEKERFGVINSYDTPTNLGVDRWLSLLGGAYSYPNMGLVIIDAGTATTIDILDHKGRHQGGWILAGVDILLEQIGNNTSQVRYGISEKPSIEFGQSTSECVNNAVWAATAGMINMGINKAVKDFSINFCILLGGNAEKLSTLIEHKNVIVDKELIFSGLKHY